MMYGQGFPQGMEYMTQGDLSSTFPSYESDSIFMIPVSTDMIY